MRHYAMQLDVVAAKHASELYRQSFCLGLWRVLAEFGGISAPRPHPPAVGSPELPVATVC